ncbi:MAG TPA: hypothetical protein VK031_08795, partial [Tissierellaceae bacterium]|nr:hypothetical protein [Tissierellaceae bacterium]
MGEIVEQKILVGGMDSDNSIESVREDKYLTAHNYRPTGTDQQDRGYGNNIESTVLIDTDTAPSTGINKDLKIESFETIGKVISIMYNSQGYHQIREYDYDTNSINVIFENLTDTDGIDILRLTPQSFVNDLRLVQERYIVITDGVNEIYCFDREELLKGYGRPINIEDITLYKPNPKHEPKSEYRDDENYSTNNLRGKLFQFRSQYKYGGNMFSAWSPMSEREVPSTEASVITGLAVGKDNVMVITVKLESDSVERVLVSSRFNDSDWFIIKDVSTEHIKSLSSTPINLTTVTETYD